MVYDKTKNQSPVVCPAGRVWFRAEEIKKTFTHNKSHKPVAISIMCKVWVQDGETFKKSAFTVKFWISGVATFNITDTWLSSNDTLVKAVVNGFCKFFGFKLIEEFNESPLDWALMRVTYHVESPNNPAEQWSLAKHIRRMRKKDWRLVDDIEGHNCLNTNLLYLLPKWDSEAWSRTHSVGKPAQGAIMKRKKKPRALPKMSGWDRNGKVQLVASGMGAFAMCEGVMKSLVGATNLTWTLVEGKTKRRGVRRRKL